MKKVLLALAIIAGTAFTTLAQTKSGDSGKFSIGVDPALPLGSTKDISSFAIGADIKYELPIAPSTLFTVSAGYTRFLPLSVCLTCMITQRLIHHKIFIIIKPGDNIPGLYLNFNY